VGHTGPVTGSLCLYLLHCLIKNCYIPLHIVCQIASLFQAIFCHTKQVSNAAALCLFTKYVSWITKDIYLSVVDEKDMTYSSTKGRNLTVDENGYGRTCVFPCASCTYICLRVNAIMWCSDKGTDHNRYLPFVVVNVKCMYDFLNGSSVTCLHLRFI